MPALYRWSWTSAPVSAASTRQGTITLSSNLYFGGFHCSQAAISSSLQQELAWLGSNTHLVQLGTGAAGHGARAALDLWHSQLCQAISCQINICCPTATYQGPVFCQLHMVAGGQQDNEPKKPLSVSHPPSYARDKSRKQAWGRQMRSASAAHQHALANKAPSSSAGPWTARQY